MPVSSTCCHLHTVNKDVALLTEFNPHLPPRVSVVADDELRDLHVCNVAEKFGRLVGIWNYIHPSLEPPAAALLPQSRYRCHTRGASTWDVVGQLRSLNQKWTMLTSFQAQPWIDAKLCEVKSSHCSLDSSAQAGERCQFTAISDVDLVIGKIKGVARVHGACVVRECVHSSKRWLQTTMAEDDFLLPLTACASNKQRLTSSNPNDSCCDKGSSSSKVPAIDHTTPSPSSTFLHAVTSLLCVLQVARLKLCAQRSLCVHQEKIIHSHSDLHPSLA